MAIKYKPNLTTERLTEKLIKLGFKVPFVYRYGPCLKCSSDNNVTYYNPVTKHWLCEECFYGDIE